MDFSSISLNNIDMKKIQLTLLAAISSFFALAQDAKVDIDLNKGGGASSFPWIWVIGGAVFILLLVALLRGRSAD